MMLLNKIENELARHDMGPDDIVNVIAHFIIMYREPVANTETRHSNWDINLRDKMKKLYDEVQPYCDT